MTESDQIRLRAQDIASDMRARGDERHVHARALLERADALRTRRDARLDEVTRAQLVTDIVRLDKRDTAPALRAKHDAYLVQLGIGAIEREAARLTNDLMDAAYDQAAREVGRASASHALARRVIADARRDGAARIKRPADAEHEALERMRQDASIAWTRADETKGNN